MNCAIKITALFLVCVSILPAHGYDTVAMRKEAMEHYALGAKYYDEGKFQEADKEYSAASILLEKAKQAQTQVNEKPKKQTRRSRMKDEANKHYALGAKYYNEGKFKEADNEFKISSRLLKKYKDSRDKMGPELPEPRTEVASAKTYEEILSKRTRRIMRPEYVIGPEDVLSVFVWQNPDLTQEVTVQPDGRISFPLIDSMEVEGLTIPQLDKLITENLREYIKYPEVSISIRRLGGKRVIVLGQVQFPGVFQVSGTESVLEAIAMAGGFTNESLASSVVVIKGVFAGDPWVIRASANMALKGVISQNVRLEFGDVIFVPKKPISDLNWLATEISAPLMAVTGDISAIKTLTHIRTKIPTE